MIRRISEVAVALGVVVLMAALGGAGAPRRSAAATPTPTPTPRESLTLASGWNLIPGKLGPVLPCCFGPFYTLQAGDSAYEVIERAADLEPDLGYWVFFDREVSVTLIPPFLTGTYTVRVPAGQWVMVGNPFITIANVQGADAVYVYDTAIGYRTADAGVRIGPQQGAFVYSLAGSTVTLSVALLPSGGGGMT